MKEERLVILIDDDYDKGWADLFPIMFKKIYGDLIEFQTLTDINNKAIGQCYKEHPEALFIQDNQLGTGVVPGVHWLQMYSTTHHIIMFSADDIGYQAGKLNAYFFMKKDNPEHPMSNEEMRDMIVEFHRHVIKHFGLIPELMWIVYDTMGYWPEKDDNNS